MGAGPGRVPGRACLCPAPAPRAGPACWQAQGRRSRTVRAGERPPALRPRAPELSQGRAWAESSAARSREPGPGASALLPSDTSMVAQPPPALPPGRPDLPQPWRARALRLECPPGPVPRSPARGPGSRALGRALSPARPSRASSACSQWRGDAAGRSSVRPWAPSPPSCSPPRCARVGAGAGGWLGVPEVPPNPSTRAQGQSQAAPAWARGLGAAEDQQPESGQARWRLGRDLAGGGGRGLLGSSVTA